MIGLEPKALLKVVLYGYYRGIISSRRIAEACRRNVVFIALSADSRPHLTTIASFVSNLENEIASLFGDVLLYASKLGFIDSVQEFQTPSSFQPTPQRRALGDVTPIMPSKSCTQSGIWRNLGSISSSGWSVWCLDEQGWRAIGLPNIGDQCTMAALAVDQDRVYFACDGKLFEHSL